LPIRFATKRVHLECPFQQDETLLIGGDPEDGMIVFERYALCQEGMRMVKDFPVSDLMTRVIIQILALRGERGECKENDFGGGLSYSASLLLSHPSSSTSSPSDERGASGVFGMGVVLM
jgi:hypothetical protein